ncbi:MAG: ABC transporter permease [Anaerolineae bacterium]|jgi:peptide/nickel transport system permease protein|nr:ABC transporter permease [Anaerolineae bacterium]
MTRYILRRLLEAVPLLTLITIFVFLLLQVSGDPLAYLAQDPRVREGDRALLRARYGLDDPLPVRFVTWLVGDDWRVRDCNGDGTPDCPGVTQGILRGDLGESIRTRQPVEVVFANALPNTLLLGLTVQVVVIIVALCLGIFTALRPYSAVDNVLTGFSFIAFSMPVFLIALLLVQVFAIQFRAWGLPFLPTGGMYDARGDRSLDELIRHMILPVLSLSLIQIAGYSRYIRATMLEVINSDYIRTARAKGLINRRIVFLHALKNASLPIITLIALDIPGILSGAVITETIFSWPGMGRLFIQSLEQLDPPVLMVFVLITAVAVVLFQLVADILYAMLDPRVRYN